MSKYTCINWVVELPLFCRPRSLGHLSFIPNLFVQLHSEIIVISASESELHIFNIAMLLLFSYLLTHVGFYENLVWNQWWAKAQIHVHVVCKYVLGWWVLFTATAFTNSYRPSCGKATTAKTWGEQQELCESKYIVKTALLLAIWGQKAHHAHAIQLQC